MQESAYRVALEALHNADKHARAGHVAPKMACDPERISLEIFEDGVAFDAGGDFPGHLGLRSMRERAYSAWAGRYKYKRSTDRAEPRNPDSRTDAALAKTRSFSRR